MSVRKSTLRASGGQSAGMNLLKNVGFWAFMLIASFLIGFLIISPLINVATGSRADTNPGQTAASNPAPAPSNNAAAPQSESRRRGENESPIEITPDRTVTTPQVQQPGSVEGERPGRQEQHTADGGADQAITNTDPSLTREPQREGTDGIQSPETTDRTERTDRTGRGSSTTTSETTDARRSHRRRNDRPRTDDAGGTRLSEPSDTGIQRGEGIDR